MCDVSESVGGGSECPGLRKESEKILRWSTYYRNDSRLKWDFTTAIKPIFIVEKKLETCFIVFATV